MDEIINSFRNYSSERQNEIRAKYNDIIGILYKTIDKDYLDYILYSLEYVFKYINEKYKDEDSTIKAWCVVNLMRKIKSIEIHNDNDINNLIDKTIEHLKNDDYKNYLNDIDFFASEYSRDLEYINKLSI